MRTEHAQAERKCSNIRQAAALSAENRTTFCLANWRGTWQPTIVTAKLWPSQIGARWHSGGRFRNKYNEVQQTCWIDVPTIAEMAAMKTGSQTDAMAPGSQTGSIGHQPNASGSSELKGARILLVEDSWQLGNAMKRLLRVLGADVAGPAASIADAERLLAERTADVAIVDINLRDGERANGLIDRLQEQRIPVVVVSGYTDVSLPPGTVEAILQKPVSMEQFLAILRPIIARKTDR